MKKPILAFLILGVFGLGSLHSQNCPSIPYVLDISGFYSQCGNAQTGQVCFEYWSGVLGPDCDDIVVIISYPTANFAIDLPEGDFVYWANQSNGTSFLSMPIELVSNGNLSRCFTGTLLVPNTTFTLLMYYSTNPNLPLYEQETFTVDNIIPVGTAGQPTSLNSLWVNNILVDPGNSTSTPQRIAVLGTLRVDNNYSFISSLSMNGDNYSELIMMPGSALEVTGNGISMTTRYVNIHGCEGATWEGIRLLGSTTSGGVGGALKMETHTTLSDAQVGVEMQRNSSFDFVDSDITNCDIGVGSFGTTLKNISFTGSNNANSLSSFVDCNEGLHFENTSMIDLTTGLRGLQFYNMEEFGIYLEGTDLLALYPYFSNCENGIFVARANNKLHVDNIGCFGRGGRGVGIFTVGTTDLRVNKGTITNFGTGIDRRTTLPGEYSYISNLNMRQCVNNVWGSVLASSGTITQCDLNAASHNVWLSGIGNAAHNWSVIDNTGLNSGTAPPDNMPPLSYFNRNIFFSGANHASIVENKPFSPLLGINGVTSPFTNIEISGGQRVFVSNNILNAQGSAQSNMRFSGCPMSTIDCNAMNQARTALTVLGGCTGSSISANDFSGAWGANNLVYGFLNGPPASTSPQDKMGNRFDLSSPGNARARYFGSNLQALLSQYIVGKFTPSPNSPNGTVENVQGNATYPYFLPASSQWFFRDNFGVDNLSCATATTEDDKLEKSVRNNIGLLNLGIGTEYGAEVEFDTKLKLFRHLDRLQQLTTLAPDLATWHSSLSSTDFSKFIDFEQAYEAAISLTSTQEAQASQLNLEIGALANEMAAIEWWVTDPVTGQTSIDPVLLALYESKKASKVQKVDELHALVQARRTNLTAQLGNLQGINNSIGMQATVSGQNLKTMNNLLVQRYDAGFEGFSTADVNVLTQIAQQCVVQGGEGVYIARALLAEQLGISEEYNDECFALREAGAAKAVAVSTMTVMPNPAGDRTSVVLPEGHNISYLLLLDALGRQVQTIKLDPQQTVLNLETNGLANGVYFLAPSDKSSSPVKFTVLH